MPHCRTGDAKSSAGAFAATGVTFLHTFPWRRPTPFTHDGVEQLRHLPQASLPCSSRRSHGRCCVRRRARGLQAGEPVQALPPRTLVIRHGQPLLQQAPQRLHHARLLPFGRLRQQLPWSCLGFRVFRITMRSPLQPTCSRQWPQFAQH